jgi:hypothetical protein
MPGGSEIVALLSSRSKFLCAEGLMPLTLFAMLSKRSRFPALLD